VLRALLKIPKLKTVPKPEVSNFIEELRNNFKAISKNSGRNIVIHQTKAQAISSVLTKN